MRRKKEETLQFDRIRIAWWSVFLCLDEGGQILMGGEHTKRRMADHSVALSFVADGWFFLGGFESLV